MNRRVTASELSASIAHEVKQPLAAIATNASAALRWLTKGPSEVGEARAALERIVDTVRRAGDVIDTIRAMFKKSDERRRSEPMLRTEGLRDFNWVLPELTGINYRPHQPGGSVSLAKSHSHERRQLRRSRARRRQGLRSSHLAEPWTLPRIIRSMILARSNSATAPRIVSITLFSGPRASRSCKRKEVGWLNN
jgi:hypothetical protein